MVVKIDKIEYRKQEIPITPQPTVDMDVMEYIYAATWEDITGDEKLMNLIMNNGYYKTALCDAFEIERMTLTVGNKKWKLAGVPRNISSQLDVFYGKTKVVVADSNIINKELKNINKITPLVER